MTDDILARLDLIEKAIAVLAEQTKATHQESALNFLLIDEILEAHSDCLDVLVEESPDLEMIYREDDEDRPTATILTLVIDNDKDKGGV